MTRRDYGDDDPRIAEHEYDAEPGHGLYGRIESDEAADRYERALTRWDT